MICDRILGSVADSSADVDWVRISWHQTARRAMRLKSDAGLDISILLPRNVTLHHGDIVCYAGAKPVAIWVESCDLLVFEPRDKDQAAAVALELGLLHIPTEITHGTIRTPDDGPAKEIAERLDVQCRRAHDRFHPVPATILLPLHDSRMTGRD